MKAKRFKRKLSLKKETISNLARIRGGDVTSVGPICFDSCDTDCDSKCYSDCPSILPDCNRCR
jgi:hypothetical protein